MRFQRRLAKVRQKCVVQARGVVSLPHAAVSNSNTPSSRCSTQACAAAAQQFRHPQRRIDTAPAYRSSTDTMSGRGGAERGGGGRGVLGTHRQQLSSSSANQCDSVTQQLPLDSHTLTYFRRPWLVLQAKVWRRRRWWWQQAQAVRW